KTAPAPPAPLTLAPILSLKQSGGLESVGLLGCRSNVNKNVPSPVSSYTGSISLVLNGPMPYAWMVVSVFDHAKCRMFFGPIVKAPAATGCSADGSKRLPMPNHYVP